VSTWFAQRVIDILSTLNRIYTTSKYETMAERLGRPRLEIDARRGFVIVQIDGLSYEHLQEAVARGYMPTVGRLLSTGGLGLVPWRCGLPSTTPAVQAGLMFGNRYDIPGFRWYEKEQRLAVLTRRPDHARRLRALISQGRPGILRGGSCYVSVFDGDADLALFTLSTLHSQRFFESVRGMGLFLLFLLSPLRALRVLALISRSYAARLGRRLMALVRPGVDSPFDILSPLLHSVSDVIFTEVQTFGVMLDIYRNVPAIYANYTGYDEVAHRYGPSHVAALRALRGIDGAIRQINRMRLRPRGRDGRFQRPYDLYLMSDHGNTASQPFEWLHGQSLGRYVVSLLKDEHVQGEDLRLFELMEGHPHSADKARYLLEELRVLERRLPPRLRRAFVLARLHVRRRLWQARREEYDLSRQGDVIVSASGPLAHVYFGVAPRPLDLIEVMLLYPRLLDRLLETPGIGALVGRAGERTLVLGADGGVLVVGGSSSSLDGPHPLAPFGDPAYAASQLHRLLHFPHAGDLAVLGAMRPDGRVVTFEKQMATHGGLGGVQTRPFIASTAPGAVLGEAFDDAEDLYPYFARNYVDVAGAEWLALEEGIGSLGSTVDANPI